MRAIQLDYVVTKSPSLLGVGVLVIALLIALAIWQYTDALSQQAKAWDIKIQQLKTLSGVQSPVSTRKKSSAETQAKLDQAKQLADFLLVPWGDLFSALEAAALDDAVLLAIEPDAKKRQLKITAEAKNKEVMFAYIQRLEATPQLHGAYLLKHEIQQDSDQHPIWFVVMAKWAGRS